MWGAGNQSLLLRARQVLKYGQGRRLRRFLSAAAARTNDQVVRLIFRKFRLMAHLNALKKYLLLGQGDFIQGLMTLVSPHLSEPASQLFRHSLLPFLETAVRTSNAQYDDHEILSRLDVRLMTPSPGKKEKKERKEKMKMKMKTETETTVVQILFLSPFYILW